MAENSGSRLRLKELKSFGYSFGSGMAILTGLGLIKGFHPALITSASLLSVFHLIGALAFPGALGVTHKLITFSGRIVSIILTSVFFTVFYYALFTPFALIYKLTGKDVIGRQSRVPRWMDVPPGDNDPSRIEKQY
ncbi:MAG: hypothetical protein JXR86_05885 [Spirochaetales bacterium]|nr:hypothetical protein [Spirochaetales bacterium]